MILLFLAIVSCANFNFDLKDKAKKKRENYQAKLLRLSKEDEGAFEIALQQDDNINYDRSITKRLIESCPSQFIETLINKIRLSKRQIEEILEEVCRRYEYDNKREAIINKLYRTLDEKSKGKLLYDLASSNKWEDVEKFFDRLPVVGIFNRSYYHREQCLLNVAIAYGKDHIRDRIIERIAREDLRECYLIAKSENVQSFFLNILDVNDYNKMKIKKIDLELNNVEVINEMIGKITEEGYIDCDNFVEIFFSIKGDKERRKDFVIDLYDNNRHNFDKIKKYINKLNNSDLNRELLEKYIQNKEFNTLKELKHLSIAPVNGSNSNRKSLSLIEEVICNLDEEHYDKNIIYATSKYLHLHNIVIKAIKDNKIGLINLLASCNKKSVVKGLDMALSNSSYDKPTFSKEIVSCLLDNNIICKELFNKICKNKYNYRDDVELVEKFLEKGYTVNDDLFNTALSNRQYQVCKLFVERGFEVYKQFSDIYKPYLKLTLEEVKAISYFIDIPKKGEELCILLSTISFDDTDIIDELADLNIFLREEREYLEVYLQNDYSLITERNIRQLFYVSAKENISKYLLDLIKRRPYGNGGGLTLTEGIDLLISLGCCVDDVVEEIVGLYTKTNEINGSTFLHLITKTKELTPKIMFKSSILMKAIEKHDLDLVEYLLENGAFVNQSFEDSKSILERIDRNYYVDSRSQLRDLIKRYGAEKIEGKLPSKKELQLLIEHNLINYSLNSRILGDDYLLMVLIEKWSDMILAKRGDWSFSSIEKEITFLRPAYYISPNPHDYRFNNLMDIYNNMRKFIFDSIRKRVAFKILKDDTEIY